MKQTLFAAFALLVISSVALGHAPPVGPNGGRQVNAGPYHVELVVHGEDVNVYVTDHAGSLPRDAGRLSGNARLTTSDGSSSDVTLVTRTPGLLVGKSDRALQIPQSGTIDLRTPSATIVRATFR